MIPDQAHVSIPSRLQFGGGAHRRVVPCSRGKLGRVSDRRAVDGLIRVLGLAASGGLTSATDDSGGGRLAVADPQTQPT
jgi:hypothetical protein